MSQPSIREPHPVKCDCDSCVEDTCGECEGTGKVAKLALEGNEWIVDGEKDCICIINQKEND